MQREIVTLFTLCAVVCSLVAKGRFPQFHSLARTPITQSWKGRRYHMLPISHVKLQHNTSRFKRVVTGNSVTNAKGQLCWPMRGVLLPTQREEDQLNSLLQNSVATPGLELITSRREGNSYKCKWGTQARPPLWCYGRYGTKLQLLTV